MARETLVDLRSNDPSVLAIALALPEVLDASGENADWSFVLLGVKVGATTVTVRIDGAVEGEIAAVVEPQPQEESGD
jgi:hypothetical protein